MRPGAAQGLGDNAPRRPARGTQRIAERPNCMHIRRPSISDRKVRFALVGCGRIAQNHFEALRQHEATAELVAVCDTDPAALRAAVQHDPARRVLRR